MQVTIQVPEALVTRVRPGQQVVVQVDAFPERVFPGQVCQVANQPSAREWQTVDEKVYRTTVQIDGKANGLKPGMSASVAIRMGKDKVDGIAVPARALIGTFAFGKTASCLVLTKDGPAEREVGVGLRNNNAVVITAGLREGDEVIVNPQLLLNEIRAWIESRSRGSRPKPKR
jgi:HlyD family secretion protein